MSEHSASLLDPYHVCGECGENAGTEILETGVVFHKCECIRLTLAWGERILSMSPFETDPAWPDTINF